MKKYKFSAQIEPGDGGGAYVLFPYDVEKEFGTKGRIPVRATFEGVPYTGSLIKYGNPKHMLPILKGIREEIGKGLGDSINVEVWKDDGERTVAVPAPLQQAMKQAGVTAAFDSLSFTHRREYCRWIADAKREETRSSRVKKAVEMLRAGIKTPDSPGIGKQSRKMPGRA